MQAFAFVRTYKNIYICVYGLRVTPCALTNHNPNAEPDPDLCGFELLQIVLFLLGCLGQILHLVAQFPSHASVRIGVSGRVIRKSVVCFPSYVKLTKLRRDRNEGRVRESKGCVVSS